MSKGIYGYFDIENNYWAYIGKDSNIDKNSRRYDHRNPSTYNRQKINQTIQNNPDRYIYHILLEVPESFSTEEINDLEKHYINLLKTFKYDYPNKSVFNFTKGGEGLNGIIFTDECCKKISNSLKGQKFSISRDLKISLRQNTTGYFRVSIQNDNHCKQGYRYRYRYYDENVKAKKISSISLKKLEQKVKEKNLPWIRIKKTKLTLLE